MKIPNNKEAEWKYFQELVDVVHRLSRDKKLLKEFMLDILTPRELVEISKRWQIAKMIKGEIPHQRIAKELSIGVGTVTRGSREMHNPRGGFRLALAKLGK